MIADPEVFALGSVAAEFSHAIVGDLVVELEVVSVVGEPEVVALVFAAAEPEVVFVAVVSVADVAELQASVDIAAAFHVLVLVSVFAVEVDSSGRPKFLAVPNVGHYATSSSSVEVVG